MWQLVKTVLDLGGEPVTLRGIPTKKSEQEVMLKLLDRDIDVLVVALYSLEDETAYIVDKAHEMGIKTVGFGVNVKDSPVVLEDTWATAMTLGYYLFNVLNRQGTIVQTAEEKGFYTFRHGSRHARTDGQVRAQGIHAAVHVGQRLNQQGSDRQGA